jgi:hypothetical protein
MNVEKYLHHGAEVSVQTELKGKHRAHCLCYGCEHFKPTEPDRQCKIAQVVYANCVAHNLVTPVYECAKFEAKK